MVANPIRIVPLRLEAAAPAVTPRLTYRGGPLLRSVKVFLMFWGEAWSQPALSPLAGELSGFFDFVLTSSLMDQLSEYDVDGASIGHGSRIGTTVVTSAPDASVADSDIQQMIQDEISSDPAVPQPTPSTLYVVFLPPGVTVGLNGGSSCTTFCGYHLDIQGEIFYAVLPYPDCSGCMVGLSVQDALTSVASHELCEAISDPVAGQGWYDDRNGEIADICAWKTKQLGQHTVQLEWSNQANRCL